MDTLDPLMQQRYVNVGIVRQEDRKIVPKTISLGQVGRMLCGSILVHFSMRVWFKTQNKTLSHKSSAANERWTLAGSGHRERRLYDLCPSACTFLPKLGPSWICNAHQGRIISAVRTNASPPFSPNTTPEQASSCERTHRHLLSEKI